MLQYLTIKNFALIENCELELGNGLNIISGETGSGKSIIIQALGILLGGRASVEHIRSGMDEAIISGTIDITNAPDLAVQLSEKGILIENNELLLRRILTRSGKSRSYINGSQVTSRELQLVFSRLFDFHGQHEGVSLLRKSTHCKYLDLFCNLKEDVFALAAIYKQIQDVTDSLATLKESETDKEKKIDLLQYEIEEIDTADLTPNEDVSLKEQIKVSENYEKLMECLGEARMLLQGQNGVLSSLRMVKLNIEKSAEMDKTWNDPANDIADIYYRLEDVAQSVTTGSDRESYEPGTLDSLIERSEFLEKLKRKYGGSLESVALYREKAQKELELIQFSSEKFEQLQAELDTLTDKYVKNAVALSAKRVAGARQLELKVKQELSRLSMDKVEFSVSVIRTPGESGSVVIDGQSVKYGPNGIDSVEFMISPNLGEPLKSLSRIASGGELSRIILALKTVLSQSDDIETMIFDEIDSGIGGKVAVSVGHALRLLSTRKQILCITHLPQIAAAGSAIFSINKSVVSDRTVTAITNLGPGEQKKEIARMLSGHITENSLQHAEELLSSMKG
jgi:DNA repair protein RecN (Recombination protein N)